MVVICLPMASLTDTPQERIATPSIWTVQAPQSAMPQPYLVPVSPIFSRIAQSSGVSGSTSTSKVLPLIVRFAIAIPFFWSNPSIGHCQNAGLETGIVQIKNLRLQCGIIDLLWGQSRFFPPTPRNDGKTYLCDLAARFARVLAGSFRPLVSEGAGNAGRPMRPIAACAMSVVERTRVSQVTPESPGIPRAMVLRLISCSPRRPGFLATVALRVFSQDLMPASGHQDHTTSPSASGALVRSAIRVHRIPAPR